MGLPRFGLDYKTEWEFKNQVPEKSGSINTQTYVGLLLPLLSKEESFRSALSYTPTDCFTNTAKTFPPGAGARGSVLPKEAQRWNTMLCTKLYSRSYQGEELETL